jgi:hypothetical protein
LPGANFGYQRAILGIGSIQWLIPQNLGRFDRNPRGQTTNRIAWAASSSIGRSLKTQFEAGYVKLEGVGNGFEQEKGFERID